MKRRKAGGFSSKAHVHALTGDAKILKQINAMRVLKFLRLNGAASRIHLSRSTGLDSKTLTNVSNYLLDQGLITAKKTVASGLGRPAELLTLNPDKALGIGIDFGASQMSAVLVDLAGNVRTRSREEFSIPRSKTFLLKKAETVIRDLLASLNSHQRKAIAGIGVSIPGVLEREKGRVKVSVNIRGFSDVPIVDILENKLPFPVFLEKASYSMALAEIWFAKPSRQGNFICVDLGFGIGMGVVHDGLLHRGAGEMCGEIGHTVVQPRGRRCTCSLRGCLETVASGNSLGRLADELPLADYGVTTTGARAVCEAAAAGSLRAKRAVRQAGEYIGMAIANVINLLDPGPVILNGGLVQAGALLVDPIRKAVAQHTMKGANQATRIELSELGLLAGAMGAAMLPLRPFFEFDNIRI